MKARLTAGPAARPETGQLAAHCPLPLFLFLWQGFGVTFIHSACDCPRGNCISVTWFSCKNANPKYAFWCLMCLIFLRCIHLYCRCIQSDYFKCAPIGSSLMINFTKKFNGWLSYFLTVYKNRPSFSKMSAKFKISYGNPRILWCLWM